MKRIFPIILVVVLFLTSVAVPAMAYEPSQLTKSDGITEHNRGRRHHRRGRDRDWVGFGIGAGLGILGAVLDDSPTEYNYYYPEPQYYYPAPQYYYPPAQPALVYDPSCNCYYYQ